MGARYFVIALLTAFIAVPAAAAGEGATASPRAKALRMRASCVSTLGTMNVKRCRSMSRWGVTRNA